jgi:hypothetical protein
LFPERFIKKFDYGKITEEKNKFKFGKKLQKFKVKIVLEKNLYSRDRKVLY